MIKGNIFLGVRLAPSDFKRIEIENADLDNTVEAFKNQITKHVNTDKDSIELIYCGLILEDEKSLSSCGVKPGVMVHVLKKKLPAVPVPARTLTDADLQQLVVAFRAFTLSPGYRAALQRLSRPEVLETITAATPGLIDDPIAMAMLQDPELIVQLSDLDTVKRVAKHHPSLIEAANQIAAHVHEETASANPNQAGTSTGYSYSLEALSDEDDMESSNDQPREVNPLTRNTSYGAITAAQLADAILNSTNMNFGGLGAAPSNSHLQSTPASSNPAGNVITNEMFLNAIQQAFASSPAAAATSSSSSYNNPFTPGNSANAAPASQGGESVETLRTRLQPQLQQMREMGLANESLNLRALQITSGDVQGAIELVFNGAIE